MLKRLALVAILPVAGFVIGAMVNQPSPYATELSGYQPVLPQTIFPDLSKAIYVPIPTGVTAEGPSVVDDAVPPLAAVFQPGTFGAPTATTIVVPETEVLGNQPVVNSTTIARLQAEQASLVLQVQFDVDAVSFAATEAQATMVGGHETPTAQAIVTRDRAKLTTDRQALAEIVVELETS